MENPVKITINFISSKYDNNEERVMHSKSDNPKVIINDEADEVIKELLESPKKRYQNNLELMKVVRLPSIMFIYGTINVIK